MSDEATLPPNLNEMVEDARAELEASRDYLFDKAGVKRDLFRA